MQITRCAKAKRSSISLRQTFPSGASVVKNRSPILGNPRVIHALKVASEMYSRGSRSKRPMRMFFAVINATPSSIFGGVFPRSSMKRKRFSNDCAHQPFGSSNGKLSPLTSGAVFMRVSPVFRFCSVFASLKRVSSSEAGSSFGSYGTSLPRTARLRMVRRSCLI